MELNLLGPFVANHDDIMLWPIDANADALWLLKHHISGVSHIVSDELKQTVATRWAKRNAAGRR